VVGPIPPSGEGEGGGLPAPGPALIANAALSRQGWPGGRQPPALARANDTPRSMADDYRLRRCSMPRSNLSACSMLRLALACAGSTSSTTFHSAMASFSFSSRNSRIPSL